MSALILALDCSTAHGSVAVGWQAMDEPPTTPWQATFSTGRGQGGKLFTALQEALAVVKDHGEPLNRIVVGLGPGSYSGVRQAIAAATGLAVGTGARLVGAPSPLALETDSARYQAVADARRGTFYYTAVKNGVCVAGPELLESHAELETRLAERPGWPTLAVETLLEGLVAEIPVVLPTATRLLWVPEAALLQPPLEPIYLRPVAFTLPKAVGTALR